jgi:hypothetical protein
MTTKNDIWQFFTLIDHNATCNRCNSVLKYSSRHGPNNLRHHLESFACKEHINISKEDAKALNIVQPKRKPSPHDIWNHYMLVDDELARCNRCHKLVVYRSVTGPGNLKAHLKTNACRGIVKEPKPEKAEVEEEPKPVVAVIPQVIVLPEADPQLFTTI